MLPRLFFQHVGPTSFVVRDDDGELVGFLIGFLSQSRAAEAYVHFLGVAPGLRGRGLGRELYERFFAAARAAGRTTVRAVTSVGDTGSQSFHRHLGFTVGEPIPDYDGAGSPRVTFHRSLAP